MLTKTESALFAFAVALITLALYQLWLPINYHQEQNVLGELGFLENSAKLKVSGDLVWRDARRGDPVSQGSSVFTGEQAQAVVSMNSGSSIQLGANTLIRINERVQLENGLVHTTLGSQPLELSISGVNYRLEGEGARLQLSQSALATTLSVVKGELKVAGVAESFELKKDQGLEVGAGSAKKVVYEIPLLSPQAGAKFWTRDLERVSFEWQSATAAKLEVSRDLNFTETLFSQELAQNTQGLELPVGTYYWRVSQGDKVSRIGEFSILAEQPIILMQPKAGTVIELAAGQKVFTQLLQWSDTKVQSYELLLEREGVLEIIELQQTDYSLKLSKTGELRWKVRPKDSDRPKALESEWSRLILLEAQDFKAPVWPSAFVELSKSREDQSADLRFESTGLEHEWVLELKGEIISTTRQVTREMSFPYQEKAGEYELKVRSFNKFGEASPWSEPLKVNWIPFQVREPIRGQEIKLERPDQRVNFQWEGEGEQSFELSKDEDFSQIIITRKAVSATEIVFPEVGTYFWRVRRLDGTYSPPTKVKVEPSPPLSAPEAPPELKQELKLEFKSEKKTSLWDLLIPRAFAEDFKGTLSFSLPGNEKAEGYKVEIFADEQLSQLVFTSTIVNPQVEWQGARPGQFWYRYALIDAWGRESEMSPASVLNVIAGQMSPPERARLLRPIRAQIIEPSPFVTLAWTASARTQSYQLQISNVESFSETLMDLSLNTNQHLVDTKDFKLGEMYYWRVFSRHQFGETSSSTGRFVYGVKPSAPEPTSPAAKLLRPLSAYSFLSLNWTPQTLTSKINEKEFNAQIDGLLLNALEIQGRRYFTKSWALDLKLSNQAGKVFSSQDYLYRELQFAGTYSLSQGSSLYHLSLGAAQVSGTRFRLATPEELKGETQSSIAGAVKVEWEKRFEKTDSLHSSLALLAGDVSALRIELFYRRFYPRYFVQSGVSYQGLNVKTKTGSNEGKLLGLSIGAGLSF